MSVKEAPKQTKTFYADALREAIFEEMERNPDMICQGEDIGILGRLVVPGAGDDALDFIVCE